MGIVRVSTSVSLDGFSSGPDVSEQDPMGVGGERLHRWLFPALPVPRRRTRRTPPSPRTCSPAPGRWWSGAGPTTSASELWGDTPFPVPTFVVTHREHEPRPMTSATFTFVTDGVASAVAQAVTAAGDRDVLVMGGAETWRQALARAWSTRSALNLVPVLLHRGERLLDIDGDRAHRAGRTGLVATDEART